MKQHITEEQWNEIVKIKNLETIGEVFKILKLDLSKFHDKVYSGAKPWEYVTIGKMIEILGVNLQEITFISENEWLVDLYHFNIIENELCDALFKAIKEVL